MWYKIKRALRKAQSTTHDAWKHFQKYIYYRKKYSLFFKKIFILKI